MSSFFSSRRRHTRCALVTGVQTCALPILIADVLNRGQLSSGGRVRIGGKKPRLAQLPTAPGEQLPNQLQPPTHRRSLLTGLLTNEGDQDRKSTRLNSSH